jgi:hypothetical protein
MPVRQECRGCDRSLTAKRKADGKPYCCRCESARVRQRKAARHERLVRVRYGLLAGEYLLIKAAQGGVCAICQRAKGTTKNLAVDHNHKTGEVRGLLCDRCNQTLGHFRDDTRCLHRAIAYLENPPARLVLAKLPNGRAD